MFYQLSELLRLAIVATICCSFCGCGSDSQSVPVEGVVTLDGRPLADATVVLTPITAAGPGPFSGTTDAEGKFSLGPSANPELRSAIPGEYRLSISTVKYAPIEGGDDSAKPQVLSPELVPDEYRVGDMRFEVPASGTDQANFDLESGR